MFDCIIIGGGYFSVGYVKNHPNSVFIERGELLDKYFCGSFNQGKNWGKKPKSKNSAALSDYFKSLNIICGDKADIAALETAFCSFLKDELPNCLMLTDTVKIEKENGIFSVTVYNNEGFSVIKGKKIIINAPFNSEKSMAVRFLAEESEIKRIFPGAICEKGFAEGEIYAYIPSDDDSTAECKMKIIDKWCSAAPNGKLVYTAPEFKYSGKDKIRIEGEIIYVDESAFENAFEAYEYGDEMK